MEGRLMREDARNVRAENFLTEGAADFAHNTVATAKIAQLTAANAAVAEQRQNQIGGAGDVRQDYETYADAFDALVDDMETIRDFAASMARDVPGLETKFRIPRSGGKPAKIAAAYVFADDAEAIKQKFLDYGIEADFIAHLRAKADAAQNGLNAAQTSTGKKVGATGALAVNVKTASDTVESLRPIVKYTYRDNPSKFTEWNHLAKVERHTPAPQPKKPLIV